MRQFYNLFLFLVYLAASAQDGSNDSTFNPTDTGFGNGANDYINAVGVQTNGKIIIGGEFTHYNSLPSSRLIRINADETLDDTFSSNIYATGISSLAIQPDDKIVVSTSASSGSPSYGQILRVNENGEPDTGFALCTHNGLIYRIVLQPDGKILVGGSFTEFNGEPRNYMVRLMADGTEDTSFNIGTGFNNIVRGIAVQPDNKMIVVGNFTSFNGTSRNKGARLNTNGSLDTTFTLPASPTGTSNSYFAVAIQQDGKIILGGSSSTNGTVNQTLFRVNTFGNSDWMNFSHPLTYKIPLDIVIQPDGKILAGGAFGMERVNTNGSIDATFNVEASGNIWDIELLPNQKMIIAGWFTSVNNEPANYIAGLNADGTTDTGFDMGPGTGADGRISGAVTQNSGKVVIAGDFSNYNGVNSKKVARIDVNGDIDTSFTVGSGPNGVITDIVVTTEDKIILTGQFTTFNGVTANGIVRLGIDGGVDNTFNTGTGIANSTTTKIAVQPDGALILYGLANYNGITLSSNFCRLAADGTLDQTFSQNVAPLAASYQTVHKIVVLPSGKILVEFLSVASNQQIIIRLNPDGTLDNTFTALLGSELSQAEEMVVSADGKIYVSGSQSGNFKLYKLHVNGTIDVSANNLGLVSLMFPQSDGKIVVGSSLGFMRLNNDLSIDTTFDAGIGPNGKINSILAQNDKLIIAGEFTSYNGIGRNRIARLQSTGAMDVEGFINSNSEIIVYRVDNKLNVASAARDISSVEIYDLTGKLIAKQDKLKAHVATFENVARGNVLIVKTYLYNGQIISQKTF